MLTKCKQIEITGKKIKKYLLAGVRMRGKKILFVHIQQKTRITFGKILRKFFRFFWKKYCNLIINIV